MVLKLAIISLYFGHYLSFSFSKVNWLKLILDSLYILTGIILMLINHEEKKEAQRKSVIIDENEEDINHILTIYKERKKAHAKDHIKTNKDESRRNNYDQ